MVSATVFIRDEGATVAGLEFLLVGWDAADWKVIRPLLAAGAMPRGDRAVPEPLEPIELVA